MQRFADLLDSLSYQPGRNGKLALIEAYLRAAPDPDRGWALAALTGDLSFRHAKAGAIRKLIEARTDPVLFALSYDYVGDLAETAALMWPARPGANRPPELAEVVEGLAAAGRDQVPEMLAGWLDTLDATGRWALLKLVTGGLRVGVSARLAKTAAAQVGGVDAAEIEELWHALAPPYASLFAWLEGRTPKPDPRVPGGFRPLMLSHPVGEGDLAALSPADVAAEWKWDGIRVQAAGERGTLNLYSRTGEDLSGAFPDLAGALSGIEATLDGELLVMHGGEARPFNDLQQRLGRKSVSAKLMREYPVGLRLYDLLIEDGEDLRELPFMARRARLEAWFDRVRPGRADLSPLVAFSEWAELDALRSAPPHPVIEGVMLKRRDAPYLAGRPKGYWWKWKRDPFLVDAVLMYAQRGHGKRSSFYSDFTFGCWTAEGDLVPVGKAYFGFTDAELKQLDRFVRDNTVARYGPVREVRREPAHGLVLEIAFEGVARSARHKSGVAMRFPRVHRIRWDKPPAEADTVATLEALVP